MRSILLCGLLLAACSAQGESFLDGGTGGDGGNSAAGDTSPPSFAGASSATSGPNSVTLSWSSATDNVSPAAQISYLVYQAGAAGGETFNQPSFTTAPGVTSFSIGKLAIRTTYYFVVRARDEAGNIDSNRVEVNATTPATSDMMAPTFAGLSTASAAGSMINLSWTAANDAVTGAAQMVYNIYQATSTGGQNFTSPTYTTAAGQTTYSVGGLTPGQTSYFVVRAQDQAGNIDSNKVEKSATPAAPSFKTDIVPIFTNNCANAGCHNNRNPAEGLDLSSAIPAYSGLVNVGSTQCTTNKRVVPSQPDQSYLIWKLEGTGPCFSGSRMPKGTPLSAAQIATVRGWILSGATNN